MAPVCEFLDLDGVWPQALSLLEAQLPLTSVLAPHLSPVIPSLGLDFQPFGFNHAQPTLVHILVCAPKDSADYRSRVYPQLSKWWRERLEAQTEWFVLADAHDDILRSLQQDFHSRTPGDRSAGLSQDSARWTGQIKVCLERRLQTLVQQHEDDLGAAGDDRQGALGRLFNVRDRYACLFESVGLWAEGLQQYAEMATVVEAVRQKQPQRLKSLDLPTVGSGLVNRDVLAARTAVTSGRISIDDLTRYLFARKAEFLFRLGRPSDVLRSGLQLVRLMGEKVVREHPTAAKRWVTSACWDLLSQAQACPPLAENSLETKRVSAHMDEVLGYLFATYVDAAAERDDLALSLVWTVRCRDRKPHHLLWQNSLPEPLGDFQPSASIKERVDLVGADLRGEEVDWLEKSLASQDQFEAAYLKLVGMRVCFSAKAERMRMSKLHANELIGVAWPRKQYAFILEAVRASSNSSAVPAAEPWRALQRVPFFSVLCHREEGNFDSHFYALLGLTDELGAGSLSTYRDLGVRRAVATLTKDVSEILTSADADAGRLNYTFQHSVSVTNVLLNGEKIAKQNDRVTLTVEVRAAFVSDVATSAFNVIFQSALSEEGEEEDPWVYSGPLLHTFRGQDTGSETHVLSVDLELPRSGVFRLSEVSLRWGRAELHVVPSQELVVEVSPSNFSVALFCPVLLVPHNKSTAIVEVHNPTSAIIDVKLCVAMIRGDALIGDTAQHNMAQRPCSIIQGTRDASSTSPTMIFNLKISPREEAQVFLELESHRIQEFLEIEVSAESSGLITKTSHTTRSFPLVVGEGTAIPLCVVHGSESDTAIFQFKLDATPLVAAIELMGFDLQLDVGEIVASPETNVAAILNRTTALTFNIALPRSRSETSPDAAVLKLNLRTKLPWLPNIDSGPEPCSAMIDTFVKLPWVDVRTALSSVAPLSSSPVPRLRVGTPFHFRYDVVCPQATKGQTTLRFCISRLTGSWMISSAVSGRIKIRFDPSTCEKRGKVIITLVPLHSGDAVLPSLELYGEGSDTFLVCPCYPASMVQIDPVGFALGVCSSQLASVNHR